MSDAARIPGDEASVSILVAVEPEQAFRIFTEEIDDWWLRGPKFRITRKERSVLCLEPRLGGRLFESVGEGSQASVVETGRITAWEPPERLVFEWRAENFAPGEKTEVEVSFTPSASGTRVTVTHRGWSRIRSDHPVRHALEVPAFLRMMGLWWAELMTSLRERAESP